MICRGPNCDAEVVWAETQHGLAQPFDREPNPEGNMILLGRGPSRPPLALDAKLVDTSRGMLGVAVDECRYMPHHATCPDREQFRR